jgi:ribonuclease BN (tRNA processing enzyme)
VRVVCKQLAIIPDTNDSSSMARLAAGADVLVHDCAGTIDKRQLLDAKGHSDASKCYSILYKALSAVHHTVST